MKGYGSAEGVSGDFTVTITEGQISERGRGNQPPNHIGTINVPVSFTVTY
jgi:hypothetical protein